MAFDLALLVNCLASVLWAKKSIHRNLKQEEKNPQWMNCASPVIFAWFLSNKAKTSNDQDGNTRWSTLDVRFNVPCYNCSPYIQNYPILSPMDLLLLVTHASSLDCYGPLVQDDSTWTGIVITKPLPLACRDGCLSSGRQAVQRRWLAVSVSSAKLLALDVWFIATAIKVLFE